MAENVAAEQLQRLHQLLGGPSMTERLRTIVQDGRLPLRRRQELAHLARRAYGLQLEVSPPADHQQAED